MVWALFIPLEGTVTAVPYKVIHITFFSFSCDETFLSWNGLFQDDNSPIHRAQGITEWCDEHENDLIMVLTVSRSQLS